MGPEGLKWFQGVGESEVVVCERLGVWIGQHFNYCWMHIQKIENKLLIFIGRHNQYSLKVREGDKLKYRFSHGLLIS